MIEGVSQSYDETRLVRDAYEVLEMYLFSLSHGAVDRLACVSDILILIFIALIAGVFMVAACRQHRYLKRKQKQMLPLTSLHGMVRYATPPNGAKVPLLSDTDEEDEDMILD